MSITKTGSTGLSDRLRSSLRAKYGYATATGVCLLLDVSGSMGGSCDWTDLKSPRKIDQLRVLAADFTDVRRFQFDTTCQELKPDEPISDPRDSTGLGRALAFVKASGIGHVVLITDGQPDSEQDALDESDGLRIDCFYVGPPPAPPFLEKLCRTTGGKYGAASLDLLKELKAGVRECLQLTAGKGSIVL